MPTRRSDDPPGGRPAAARLATLLGRAVPTLDGARGAVLALLERQVPGLSAQLALVDPVGGGYTIVDAAGARHRHPRAGVRDLDDLAARLAGRGGPGRTTVVGLELVDGRQAGLLAVTVDDARRLEPEHLDLVGTGADLLAQQLERDAREHDLGRAANRLQREAATDPLTGLANRRAFERALERDWLLARRGTVASTVVVCDVDRLKTVNDELGHATGDRVIVEVATVLSDCARASDLIGRLGGDEFAVLLAGCADVETAAAYARRADGLLRERAARLGVTAVGLSAGAAVLEHATSPRDAMAEADQHMYRTKRSARSAQARRQPAADPRAGS